MPTIYVCFLENDQEIMERHWLNRMAAWVSSANNAKIHVGCFSQKKIMVKLSVERRVLYIMEIKFLTKNVF